MGIKWDRFIRAVGSLLRNASTALTVILLVVFHACQDDPAPGPGEGETDDPVFAVETGNSTIPYVVIETHGTDILNEPKIHAEMIIYQQKAEIARQSGLEGAVAGFMQAASWGTPDKILRGLEERQKIVGDFELNVAFRFGGIPYAVAERGLKLFAKEVLPVLQAQSPAVARQAAE